MVPPEKVSLLKEMYGALFDIPVLESQLFFIYNDIMIMIKSLVMKY